MTKEEVTKICAELFTDYVERMKEEGKLPNISIIPVKKLRK